MSWKRLTLALAAACALASGASAQIAKSSPPESLGSLALVDARLVPHPVIEQAANFESSLAAPVRDAWSAFRAAQPGDWQAYVDKRTGRIEYLEGVGVPWIPGRGNALTRQDIARQLGTSARIDLAVMEGIARAYAPQVESMLGFDSRELVLAQSRSGEVSPNVWFVDFDIVRGGMPVEGARVVFRVNHGNLIQMGSENLPAAGAKLPAIALTREQARQALADYLGGFYPLDKFADRGSLHLLPASVNDAPTADGFRVGEGRGLIAVWQFSFNRAGEMGTWQGRVDATTGRVLEFFDANEYGNATGGVYMQSPAVAAEQVRPMPFANVAASTFTNSAGLFTGTSGTTTLNGQYVALSDTCGSISKAADASGNLAMGTSAGTDCTTPGSGGAGNTHSSRTQFYQVNRAKEVGRGWLPSNAWLSAKLTVNVNLNQTCNAYWNGSTLNFFKSGGGCGNTGEIAAVSLHEYGHGLDTNDGNGSSADNGTGETYGDFTAALATHSSCIGPGFRTTNCTGNGDACTACTGVRDIDFAKHTSGVAHTAANFIQARCPQPSAQNPNYVGPCGKDAIAKGVTANKREGHCESYVSSEALWDLGNRDLPSPGTGAAWSTVDRLWYLSRSTATKGFQCNTTPATWTSDGCVTGSYFRTLRAVDDDNGNLNDGTPHGGAIFAAFNRHAIACASDAGASTTFAGCTPPASPTLTLTPGNNSATASWTASGSSVYDLYRNEVGCNAGFTKIGNDLASTSFADSAVANGFTYYYQVVAHPSGNEACGGAPSTCVAVNPAVPSCTPPSAPTGLTATGGALQVSLSWTAVAGATEYHVLRSTTSGGPYTQIATTTSPSYVNTGLTCNTTYFYVVRAANSTTCESGNSNQASATTNVCSGGCTTTTLYNHNFDSATGLDGFTTGIFVTGGTTTDWRGVQTCTAASGTKVFRFGGTSCTTDYANSDFNFAQANGAAGISIPAGSTVSRLTFKHRRDFESGFDGGTLAISTDGSSYTFVPASAILAGSYNGTTGTDCPPAGGGGVAVYTGTSSSFTTTTVDLDAACNAIAGNVGGCAGKAVRIAFTTITDCGITGDGWFLDDVSVQACTP